jgi:hypothetical protein
MHAMVGIFQTAPRGRERQRQDLEERVVPLLRQQPGFVSGTWSYDEESGRSFSIIVLETESSARKLAEFIRERAVPRADLELESVTVTEVLAEARR